MGRHGVKGVYNVGKNRESVMCLAVRRAVFLYKNRSDAMLSM